MESLAAQDATMYWLSARGPTDLFLLYCFTDTGRPGAELREFIVRRSARIPGLSVRLRRTPADLNQPFWTPSQFHSEQFRQHEIPDPDWHGVSRALGALLGSRVEAAEFPWRLHVFRGVRGVPGTGATGESALVAVLQVSHALADGRGAARLARQLFGAEEPVAAARADVRAAGALRALTGVGLYPWRVAATVLRGIGAARAGRELAARTAAGEIPPPGPRYPPGPLNPAALPAGHVARVLVLPAGELRAPDRTVTALALTVVSVALARYLAERGHEVRRLGAQVPVAIPAGAGGRNNFRGVGVELHPGVPELRARSALIAAELAARRTRAVHPLLLAQDRVTAVLPAAVLRRDIERYPAAVVPSEITGHTVVSSVHRGPADLRFGGGAVRWTAGFPALGSVMHLTHGVTGLGATVTLSVHADPAVLPDPDRYVELLAAAVAEVGAAHRG
ncbi:wax ester/triacylglycerol synthase family O-acyltransferase [Nocardia asteroides]|uniref:wax ester/triacylglycerol synthase family O-acyltransferase n=1 Tax=Nocardia asteroides TaxID=1824 RepID=UPI001E2C86A2|nr:wax ester/triacylglycerol synthase family O-acyltransferase [Nocardia asteroides]UGT59467.1 wax ester/triacylglycerol synthase family O-acyltransferase [Nocardia asteroides]